MCDTFARTGREGSLFAKNSDRPRSEAQVVEWHPRRPPASSLRTQYLAIDDAPTHAVLLSRPIWLWGAEHGVNEHGVAVGNERVYADRDFDGAPALIGMDLVRLVLERSADADEALSVLTRLLETHGQGGSCAEDRHDPYDSSFLVVDGGGGWVIETSGRDWAASPIDPGAAISNRYVLGAGWTRASPGLEAGSSTHDWHDPAVDTRLADHRLDTTSRCVATDIGLDPRHAAAVLRHHGGPVWGSPGRARDPEPPSTDPGDDLSGVTVCMHARGFAATAASMVAELPSAGGPVRAWVCIGPPCVGVFVPLRLPMIPAELADPERWWQAGERRDAVEDDPHRLVGLRSRLDPVETELWQEADDLHRRDADDEAWQAFARAAIARVDRVLAGALEPPSRPT